MALFKILYYLNLIEPSSDYDPGSDKNLKN